MGLHLAIDFAFLRTFRLRTPLHRILHSLRSKPLPHAPHGTFTDPIRFTQVSIRPMLPERAIIRFEQNVGMLNTASRSLSCANQGFQFAALFCREFNGILSHRCFLSEGDGFLSLKGYSFHHACHMNWVRTLVRRSRAKGGFCYEVWTGRVNYWSLCSRGSAG